MGAEVTVTLEIEATPADGASDQIVRIVAENSRTLKFTIHGFESEQGTGRRRPDRRHLAQSRSRFCRARNRGRRA